MSGRLEGKVVLVTGAAGGQGHAAAILFARHGARLGLTDLNAPGLEEARALAEGEGAEVVALAGDIAKLAHMDAFVSKVVDRFGRIDVIHNNAGTVGAYPIDEQTEEEWDRVQAVNVRSQFFLIQRALPAMRRAGGGSIINVSSIAAIRGSKNLAAYAASKAAICGLTRALAVELAPDNIRVNAILPSTIDTPQPLEYLASFPEAERPPLEARYARHLIRRMGTPEEVANVVLFLASDESSFLTGLILPVDGGRAAW